MQLPGPKPKLHFLLLLSSLIRLSIRPNCFRRPRGEETWLFGNRRHQRGAAFSAGQRPAHLHLPSEMMAFRPPAAPPLAFRRVGEPADVRTTYIKHGRPGDGRPRRAGARSGSLPGD